MKYIIETETKALCVDTGKKVVITNLKGFRKKNTIVEDKTKPVIKKIKATSEFEQISKEFKEIEEE